MWMRMKKESDSVSIDRTEWKKKKNDVLRRPRIKHGQYEADINNRKKSFDVQTKSLQK